MMGKDFLITSRSDRRVTVEGFGGNDTVIRDMEICTGVTLVQPPNKDPILLRVNHGISIQDKSILSCNQMRAHGSIVDETPHCFGGRQSLWLHDGTFLPLVYKSALCFLPIRKPTQDELNTLVVIDITPPDDSWNPFDQNDSLWTFLEDEDHTDPNAPDRIRDSIREREETRDRGESKSEGGPIRHTTNKLSTQAGPMDMAHLSRCLGWKS
jgi:hypothetical protein